MDSFRRKDRRAESVPLSAALPNGPNGDIEKKDRDLWTGEVAPSDEKIIRGEMMRASVISFRLCPIPIVR